MTSALKDDLLPLIKNKRWGAVVDRLATENVINEESGITVENIAECIVESFKRKDLPLQVFDAFLKVFPNGALIYCPHTGKSLLHNATKNDLSAEIIYRLIERCPGGARQRDKNGVLPIHYALYWSTCPDVIRLLIKNYPEGARQAADEGALPIHDAALNCSLEVVNLLIDAYPDGVRQIDVKGRLPIHCVVMTEEWKDSLDVLNRFIELYPEGVRQQDKSGRLPTHLAVEEWEPEVVKMIDRLIEAHPEGVRQQDNSGQLPIHKAVKNCSPMRIEILNRLIKAYPEGVQKPDKKGLLPIHVAARCQEFVDVVKVLIDTYPISILTACPYKSSYLLPSEQLTAIVSVCDLLSVGDTTSYLENEEKKCLVDLAQIVVGRKNDKGDEERATSIY